MLMSSSRRRRPASSTSQTSEPDAINTTSGIVFPKDARTYAPCATPVAGLTSDLLKIGIACRVSARAVGPSRREMAIFQASHTSFASPGRMTTRLGMARKPANCSIGWCVGPSSPKPTLSCV